MGPAVLLTRPQGDNDSLGRRLEAAGVRVLVAPLLEETLLDFATDDFAHFAGLVVTSRRALAALERMGVPRGATHLPVFAVGEATARPARALGFAHVEVADATGASLAKVIIARRPSGTLLYLAGRDRSPDLEAGLRAAGILHQVRVVYAMDQARVLPPEVARHLTANALDMAAFYSRRTAEAFVALTRTEAFDRMRKALVCLCISEACAAPLAAAGFAELRVAERPDGVSLDRLVLGSAARSN